jgi:hypothetical protein
MIQTRNAYKIYLKTLKRKDHFGHLDVDVSIILNMTLNVCGLDLSDKGLGPVAGCCECGK